MRSVVLVSQGKDLTFGLPEALQNTFLMSKSLTASLRLLADW